MSYCISGKTSVLSDAPPPSLLQLILTVPVLLNMKEQESQRPGASSWAVQALAATVYTLSWAGLCGAAGEARLEVGQAWVLGVKA